MKLKDTGEDALIEKIRQRTPVKDPRVIAGIGDDAAVIEKQDGSCLLVAIDMLVENIHFTDKMTFYQIGHKAMGVNLSDIAAMGGKPDYAFVSIAMGGDMRTEDAEELYEGILAHAERFNVNILGGDTNRSPGPLVVDVCLLGSVEKKNLCLRSGAEPGDIIFVTGSLGNSALGHIKKEYFPVSPRIPEVEALLKITKPTSMIDISDGLAKDLRRICSSSKTGAKIFSRKIPAAGGCNLKTAVSWGEDFEILFTARPSEKEKLLSFEARTAVRLSCIGEILEEKEGVFMLDEKNQKTPLEGGYEHF